MEAAGLFIPILSVFAPLLKSRFFVIYYRCVTLADGTGLQVAITHNACYNTPNESEVFVWLRYSSCAMAGFTGHDEKSHIVS